MTRPNYRKAYLTLISKLRHTVDNEGGQTIKRRVRDILNDHQALSTSEDIRAEADPLSECAGILSLVHERGVLDYSHEAAPRKERVEEVLTDVSRKLDW